MPDCPLIDSEVPAMRQQVFHKVQKNRILSPVKNSFATYSQILCWKIRKIGVWTTIFLILRRPDLRSAFSFLSVNLRVNYAIYDSERISNLRNSHCVSQRLTQHSPASRGRRLLLRRSKGRENTLPNPTSPFLMPNWKFSACEKMNHNVFIINI